MPELKPVIHRILPADAASPAWPLHDAASSRQIERDAAASLPTHTLMRRAGAAVAQLALAITPHARRVWIAAGPGNNGGDGFDAAVHLQASGKTVHVTFLGDAAKLPADAADAYQRACQAGITISNDLDPIDLGPQDLAIDALLGLGATRPPEGQLASAIEQLNRCPATILSVDLPSGLNTDTGWLDAPSAVQRCVRAHHTLSLLSLKPGLFTSHGRDQSGTVWFCDLGVADSKTPASAQLTAHHTTSDRLHAQHKGSFGSVVVVGGAAGMSGAALLAGRAALHAGAGRVYVQLLDHAGELPVDMGAPELMLRREIDWHAPAAAEHTAVVGCGGGDAVRQMLPQLLSRAQRLVLDADALNAIAADASLQTLLTQRAAKGWGTVLTPHPLEAARLLGVSASDVQADRIQHARALAQRLQSVVLLKGSGTVIQPPLGTTLINPTGNAELGTAGTGDVLAGWIGSLWAQGADALSAASQAVYQHGLRADQWHQSHPGTRLTASALAASI